MLLRRLQLQSPGHYSPLEAFYEDKRAVLPPRGDNVVTACPASAWGAALNHSMHPEMKVGDWHDMALQYWTMIMVMMLMVVVGMMRKVMGMLLVVVKVGMIGMLIVTVMVGGCVPVQITHPAGCMSQFIRFFGEQIMVLWKLALLRRRILIFSPPPVGVVCYRGEGSHTHTRTRTHTVGTCPF